MNVPRTSAESGQHHPQHPHAAAESGPGRGKTVTTACERCRRRKIRCDGETPCATCRRFGIKCVRIQKNDTHALETRVRQLEAQIAELTSGLPQDANALASPQPWTPDVRLMTDFGSPGPALSVDQPFSPFAGNPSSPIEIPSIQVVDYADSASPVSPVSLSPSPSLHPLVPVLPKTISDGLETRLRPTTSTGPTVSPPMTAYPSPNFTTMPYLSPRSVPGPSRSRSSSVSSLNLDYDWASASGDLPVSGFAESNLGASMFEMVPRISESAAAWTLTRFESETLLDKYFDRTQGYSIPVDRSKLFEFLDLIDLPQLPSSGHDLPCSVSMARFHVYMAMAIGLRMETAERATTIHLLHTCYRMALDEARAPTFWTQPFGVEAAMLVMIFAQVSSQET
ncbi:hypothetical protein BJY01DRAFT_236224 [Aspergillus pseudoustus]|uniref:Zn(2)-C6 fungal-type domain-containing protein n=1 Tax=Aspergillus pseudoustus TaxID=1810923 RepID=A0ABR4JPZ9_9EURO